MKKVLIVLGAVLAVVLVAVLVGPGFIDWNEHRGQATALVKEATGRDLVIGGDVSLRILPSPRLAVEDVRLSNAPGASEPDMVRLRRLEVRIAFIPLLGGKVQVEAVDLIEPVIALEKLPDGHGNWEFTAAGKEAEAAPADKPAGEAGSGGGSSAGGPSVRVDSFVIENGTVIYRDRAAGSEERIEKLNARVAAGSLEGPFQATGGVVAHGLPLTFEASVGQMIHGRTVPLSLNLGLAGGALRLQANGSAVALDSEPGIKLKIKAEADRLSQALRGLGGGGALPGALAQPFSLQASIEASAAEASVRELLISLGDIQAQGTATARLGEVPDIEAKLALARLDLDKLLALAPEAGPGGPAAAGEAAPKPADKAGDKPAGTPAPTQPDAGPAKVAFPTGLNAAVELTIDALTYRGGAIRQARARASLANGEVSVEQVGALFPGGGEVTLLGFAVAPEGVPRFEGNLELLVTDLRGAMKWLGVEAPDVPSDRLRKLSLSSEIRLATKEAQLPGIDLTLDNSRLTGGVTVALRARPAFGADLALDRINVDGYLPKEKTAPAKDAKGAAPAANGAPAAGGGQPAAADNPFAGLSALKGMDANLRLRVGDMTLHGRHIGNILIDGTLYQGALTLREASVGDLAGASAKLAGGIAGLGGIPELKNLTYDVKARDLSGLFALAGVAPPVPPANLGAFALSGKADGSLLGPALDATVRTAGATARLTGKVQPLVPGALLDADVALSHPDLRDLLAVVGSGYRPAGKVGDLDLRTHLKAGPAALAFSGLKARVGKTEVAGEAGVALTGARPKVTAQLAANEVVVDPFLPAQRAAALSPGRGLPASARLIQPAAARAAPASGRWPADRLDLSALALVDADVTFKTPALVYDAYRFENLDVVATLADGLLKTDRLTASLFGGAIDGALQLNAKATPRLGGALKVARLDVARALKAVTGKAAATGAVDVTLDVTSSGGSVRDLVGALAGKGAFSATRLDVKESVQGSALAPVIGLVTGLNNLGNTLTAGRTQGGLADVGATFAIANGVARTNDFKLASGLGNGKATGTVDLPGWEVDVEGELDLAQSLLTSVLKPAAGANIVPFSVKGPLDAPDVKVKPASALAIPGVEKLINKDKGVGKVLKAIIPGLGGQQATPEQQPSAPPPTTETPGAPPPPPPSSQPAKPKAEDLLKGLFKGLGR